MFENVINEEAIDALTEEQVDAVLAILTKAGY
jgi:NACalpha-BTF3-like transcription factor